MRSETITQISNFDASKTSYVRIIYGLKNTSADREIRQFGKKIYISIALCIVSNVFIKYVIVDSNLVNLETTDTEWMYLHFHLILFIHFPNIRIFISFRHRP